MTDEIRPGDRDREEAARLLPCLGGACGQPSIRSWRCDNCRNAPALAIALAARTAEHEAEVAAYKRAKAENDERFMVERDEARAKLAAAAAEAEVADARTHAECAKAGAAINHRNMMEALSRLADLEGEIRRGPPTGQLDYSAMLAKAWGDRDALRAKLAAAEAALSFYADPTTYVAIGFLPDPPCGAFMDDFDAEHGDEFDLDTPRPGSRARAALAAMQAEADDGG